MTLKRWLLGGLTAATLAGGITYTGSAHAHANLVTSTLPAAGAVR